MKGMFSIVKTDFDDINKWAVRLNIAKADIHTCYRETEIEARKTAEDIAKDLKDNIISFRDYREQGNKFDELEKIE